MKRLNPGPCIVVSLSAESENFLGDNVIDIPTNLSVIRSLIHPLLEPIHVPNVLSVIIQTMTISSNKSVEDLADLFIAPDTRGYSLVDFTAMEELIPIGYNATMQAFEARAHDEIFLKTFGLNVGDIPEVLPRIEVPRWKSLERERRHLWSTLVYQAVFVFAACGLLTSLVQLVVYGGVNIAFSLIFSAVIAGWPSSITILKIISVARESRRLQAGKGAAADSSSG